MPIGNNDIKELQQLSHRLRILKMLKHLSTWQQDYEAAVYYKNKVNEVAGELLDKLNLKET